MLKKFKDSAKSKNADSKKNLFILKIKSSASKGKKITHIMQNS